MENYACAILVRDGRILLGKRSPHRRRDPDCWDVIGGRVEPGESVDQALVRELGEEIGVIPTAFTKITILPEPRIETHGNAAYHMYVVRAWSGGDPTMANDEHTELRWFTPDEACNLPTLVLPEYRHVFRTLPE